MKLKSLAFLFLATSVCANAGIREDWQGISDAISQSGNHDAALKISQSVNALSDEDLQRLYGGVDLMGLANQFKANARMTRQAATQFPEFSTLYRISSPDLTIDSLDGRKILMSRSTGNPDAEGYPSSVLCPFSPGRSDGDALLLAQSITAGVRTLLEAAKIVWSGLSRGCDQTVVVLGEGGNASLACIPADVVLAVAEVAVSVAEGVETHLATCDAGVDSAEIEGSYERLGHLHTDLEDHEANLTTHDQDIKALLVGLQATVDENQRLIKVTMSRQLEIMRLLITAEGKRSINLDVLTCTGDNCPAVVDFQCAKGGLSWPCK